jgi:hypothetical protein
MLEQPSNKKRKLLLTQRLPRSKNFWKEDRMLDDYIDRTTLLRANEKRTLKKLLKLRKREDGNVVKTTIAGLTVLLALNIKTMRRCLIGLEEKGFIKFQGEIWDKHCNYPKRLYAIADTFPGFDNSTIFIHKGAKAKFRNKQEKAAKKGKASSFLPKFTCPKKPGLGDCCLSPTCDSSSEENLRFSSSEIVTSRSQASTPSVPENEWSIAISETGKDSDDQEQGKDQDFDQQRLEDSRNSQHRRTTCRDSQHQQFDDSSDFNYQLDENPSYFDDQDCLNSLNSHRQQPTTRIEFHHQGLHRAISMLLKHYGQQRNLRYASRLFRKFCDENPYFRCQADREEVAQILFDCLPALVGKYHTKDSLMTHVYSFFEGIIAHYIPDTHFEEAKRTGKFEFVGEKKDSDQQRSRAGRPLTEEQMRTVLVKANSLWTTPFWLERPAVLSIGT